MKSDERKNDAVSPVIAVMLMLVVTIIIAAVVSGFVGGMASTSEKTPQLVLKGTYSQANGMVISHGGGDTITLSDINFMTTPTDAMGTDAAKFAWLVNRTIILDPSNSNKPIFNSTGNYFETRSFKSGDTLVISAASCLDYKETGAEFNKDPNDPPGVNANARVLWDSGTGKFRYLGSYAFGNPKNIGKSFYLDLIDKTGKVISRASIKIEG